MESIPFGSDGYQPMMIGGSIAAVTPAARLTDFELLHLY
jgi:hypothetical protein